MTVSAGGGSDAARERRRRARLVAVTLLRAVGSTIALVVVYYLLPLDRTSIEVTLGMLAVGLAAFVALVSVQVRSISRAEHPALRGVGALATSAPLFLLLFAASYYVIGRISAGNFSQPLTRTDALYFAVTVFSTVGFGDITATTEVTRVLVTGQMVADVVIVGIGARIIVDAIKHGREQQAVAQEQSGPEKDSSLP